MTETVLLFPLFMFFLFAFAKVFALLILVQKIEIASTYAARRWQLESHRSAKWEQEFDDPILKPDINNKVRAYIGYGQQSLDMDYGGGRKESFNASNFLDLTEACNDNEGPPGVKVSRTQVWNVVTVRVCTKPLNMPFYQTTGFVFKSTKYVPNRDRPIAFILPGLAP